MSKDDNWCLTIVKAIGVLYLLLILAGLVMDSWLPLVIVTGSILLVGFIYWLCKHIASARREKEARRREEERLRLQKEHWARVNASPWWRSGIPERVSLVLDVDVFLDSSPEMELWFKMIVDNAEARDWNIVILKNAYDFILQPCMKKLPERLSLMQNGLGDRLRIFHNTRTLSEYMMLEKVRPDVFFTKSVQRKIIILEFVRQNGLELAHEVRSPENWKSHFEGAGGSEITGECLSDETA